MKNVMTIIAKLHQPGLLRTLVEMIALDHADMDYSKIAVPHRWKSIETSSTEAYVLGTLYLHSEDSIPQVAALIPFSASFLFTCMRDDNGSFNLEWGASLS